MKGGGGMDYPAEYPVKLLNIHTSSFDGSYSYPPHYQKFPQLYLVLEGKGVANHGRGYAPDHHF